MKHSIHEEHAPERRRLLRAAAGRLAALAALSFNRRADAAFSDPMHILSSGPAGDQLLDRLRREDEDNVVDARQEVCYEHDLTGWQSGMGH
jgi:hypothetical protein